MAVVLVVASLGILLTSWSAASAQERDIEGEGDAAEVRISDEANENRIDQAVLGLLIIAVSMALLTLLFWWHTQPARRARILAARAGPPMVDEPPIPDDPVPVVEPALDEPLPDRTPEGVDHG